MKKLILILIAFSTLVLFITCDSATSSLTEESELPTFALENPDTLQRYIVAGVSIEIHSFKREYTLDEEILGTLRIVNRSLKPYVVIDNSWPPISSTLIIDSNGNYMGPTYGGSGLMEFQQILNFAEKMDIDEGWGQNQYYYHEEKKPTLKAYAGWYLLRFRFDFSRKALQKWIHISEEGNPLSFAGYNHWEIKDSIKVDYYIRNRISQPFEKAFVAGNPMEMVFEDYYTGEKILTQKIDPGEQWQNYLSLAGKSDQLMYKYTISKSDSILSVLEKNEYYQCYLTIHLEDFDVISNKISVNFY